MSGLMNLCHDSDQIEVFFSKAGFISLFKSDLNKNTFYFFEEDFSIGDIQNIDINIKIDPNKKIRIWSSHVNIKEYLNFLYFCYKFGENNISVIFVDDYSKYIYSIGEVTSDEIVKILKYERKLTLEQIKNYKEEWLKLVKQNSEMRIFKDDKVISVSYDYLNDYICKYYDKNNINKTIGDLISNDDKNNFSDNIYMFLINRLIKKYDM